jgi:hypothetical protein
MGAHSLGSLALWTARLGVDFEVLDPPELVAAMREIRDRLDRALLRAKS